MATELRTTTAYDTAPHCWKASCGFMLYYLLSSLRGETERESSKFKLDTSSTPPSHGHLINKTPPTSLLSPYMHLVFFNACVSHECVLPSFKPPPSYLYSILCHYSLFLLSAMDVMSKSNPNCLVTITLDSLSLSLLFSQARFLLLLAERWKVEGQLGD